MADILLPCEAVIDPLRLLKAAQGCSRLLKLKTAKNGLGGSAGVCGGLGGSINSRKQSGVFLL